MRSFDGFLRRPKYFKKIKRGEWESWVWQEREAARNLEELLKIFPNLPQTYIKRAKLWANQGLRFLITPYVISLISLDKNGNPKPNDPIWRQVFPPFFVGAKTPDEYSPNLENWEEKNEMITPICQHKYTNRAIIYLTDACLGYCVYCFRSLQSTAANERHGGMAYWKQTLTAIKKRKNIEEVILSGGDPLLYSNAQLENILADIRKIKHIKAIRIHTRAWTHNPFRIDNGFCGLLKKYSVTVLGAHVVHPNEISADFLKAVNRVRTSGASTLLLCDTPLIKNINDKEKVLHNLFMSLYVAGVKPYYLSHNMPNIPGARYQRTSVKKGLEIYNALKRHISNGAMPEYIITHQSGKKTIDESLIYKKSKISFKNWKGERVNYLDGID